MNTTNVFVTCDAITKTTGKKCQRKCRIKPDSTHIHNYCPQHNHLRQHKIRENIIIPPKLHALPRLFRAYIKRKRSRDPRNLCANTSDFYTMDELSAISDDYFIAIKCDTESGTHFYGFDIRSLNDLIKNARQNGVTKIINPYTRIEFTPENLAEIEKRNNELAKKFAGNISVVSGAGKLPIEDDLSPILSHSFEMAAGMMKMTDDQIFNLRVVKVFGFMDELGFTTQTDWFTTLNRRQYVQFFDVLRRYWLSRITEEMRIEIVPDNSRIFIPSVMQQWELALTRNATPAKLDRMRKILLDIIETIVHSTTNREARTQGSMLVLSALATVSDHAAMANPAIVGIFDNGGRTAGVSGLPRRLIISDEDGEIIDNHLLHDQLLANIFSPNSPFGIFNMINETGVHIVNLEDLIHYRQSLSHIHTS